MRIAMSSGHGKYIRGASGSPVPPELDEVDQARRVVDRTAEILNSMDGVSCVTFHDNTSHDQSTNLATITNWHNAQTRDYDVSVHFNAYDGSAHGVEVLYVTQQSLASRLSSAIAIEGEFTNRGAKYRSDLYVLNNTEQPAVLIETCFCDNTGDSNNYNANFEYICLAIAEELSGQQVPDEKPPEPVEPPDEVPSEESRVDIIGSAQGDVQVIINGTIIYGNARCRNVVRMRMTMTGDVIVSLNGEEFHNKPTEPDDLPDHPPPLDTGIPSNHKDIEATVFGGAADNEHSAYPPYDSNGNGQYLNDTDFYVSLPVSIKNYDPDNPPMVRVFKGELSGCGPVLDKGPWVINDDAYVYGSTRPIAETCYNNHQPLPSGSGNNAGKVPSNKAGIDLSPALAEQIGVDGKGIVSWMFESETDTV